MNNEISLSRRSFLKTSAIGTGGLIVAFYIPTGVQKAFAQAAKMPQPPPNAFVQIAPDNSITIVINKLEMGQGVNTSMAQLIAEELGCDWTKIHSVSAPVNAVYNHTAFGMQMTGGSSALISSWDQHRVIGASMREMLKAAAAAKWGVPIEELKVEDSFVIHPKKGKLSFGELADAAAKLPMPQNPPLKDAKDFKVIGHSMKRVDAPDKSNGKAIFGMDVRIPGMTYALIAHPPVAGAKFISMDDKKARAISGVVDVIKFNGMAAVIGRTTYAARMGRDALEIKWDLQGKDNFSNESLMADFKKQADQVAGKMAGNKGDVNDIMKKEVKKKIVAEYEFPYLAHAAMEPMNCTINFDGKSCEIWSGHQMPTVDRSVAAQILGLKPEQVKLNTTYAGGSFGRRASKSSDYIIEAVQLAKVWKKPVKMVWSREDDMRGGYYRPMNFHRVTLGMDDKNHLLAWDHRLVGQSVMENSVFGSMMIKDDFEPVVSEGVHDTPYEISNFRCSVTRPQTPVTTLWWRSVGHTHTAFVMETMIDELAHATHKDALKLRKEMLKNSPRHMAVLNLLEKTTPWTKGKAPKGRAWGIAVHESFNTVVGHMVEVSMQNGLPRVHKVWSAVDCGMVVNPEGAKTQVEGAIAFGLSAAMYGEIQIEKGEVQTSNFHNYKVLRIEEMPHVEVAFVTGEKSPTGLGEPGLPPIAPAVANAVFKLTGKRLRKLPFAKALA